MSLWPLKMASVSEAKRSFWTFSNTTTIAQCADSEVRNAFERTPYVVVLKFHVFIHISKSFNFRCALERILRYLTKTWFYTLNFKKSPSWWLSIGYWVIENDSVSDTEQYIMTQYWILSHTLWLSIRYAMPQGIRKYEILWLTTQNKVFICPLPIYIITELGAMSPGGLAVLQLNTLPEQWPPHPPPHRNF